jgi:murein DD-endopeptidase MepM/ murein hydrolase activator NlpD
MMIDALTIQHVQRRKAGSLASIHGPEEYRPVGRIKQHPVRIKRRRGKQRQDSPRYIPFEKLPQDEGSFFSRLNGHIAARIQRASAVPADAARVHTADKGPAVAPPMTGGMADTIIDNALPRDDASGGAEGDPRSAAVLPSPGSVGFLFPAILVAALALFLLAVMLPQTGAALSHSPVDYLLSSGGYNEIALPEDSLAMRNLVSYAGLAPVSAAAMTPSGAAENASAAAGEDGAIPLDLVETFAWESYKVKKGDSVSKIAAAYALSIDAVIASNSITNVKRLIEGQVIRIPNMDGIPYTVKKGDSLAKISSGMGVPLEAILDANDIQNDTITAGTVLFIPGARMQTEDLKLALGELFIYPIRGRLTSAFGWRDDPITAGVRSNHAAIDLAAVTGTPIKAAMDGRVSMVGYNGTYGNYIILTHSGGFQTMYAHMSVTSVTKGIYVNQGTKIGEVGSTGYSTGPHLHFAVYKNGRAVNPLDYLGS